MNPTDFAHLRVNFAFDDFLTTSFICFIFYILIKLRVILLVFGVPKLLIHPAGRCNVCVSHKFLRYFVRHTCIKKVRRIQMSKLVRCYNGSPFVVSPYFSGLALYF